MDILQQPKAYEGGGVIGSRILSPNKYHTGKEKGLSHHF